MITIFENKFVALCIQYFFKVAQACSRSFEQNYYYYLSKVGSSNQNSLADPLQTMANTR